MTVRQFLCVRAKTINCVTCHPKTGRVTYFDPLKHDWIENAPTIPIHALAVLPADEEARVRRFLANHNVFINP